MFPFVGDYGCTSALPAGTRTGIVVPFGLFEVESPKRTSRTKASSIIALSAVVSKTEVTRGSICVMVAVMGCRLQPS